MFSGIVQQIADIYSVADIDNGRKLVINLPDIVNDIAIGDSVSVNGVCLTATSIQSSQVTFDVVIQTLMLTNLADLQAGDKVNVELSIQYGDRVGGHLIQGHVDQTVSVLAIEVTGSSQHVTFKLPKALQPYLIAKGFVAIDGMSITLQAVQQDSFSVAFIPHTQQVTICQYYQPGSKVNIEVDVNVKTIITTLEKINEKN